MTNKTCGKKWDMEKRTAKFGETIMRFCKKIPKNSITFPLISQLIKDATSVGANYCEADDAEHKKDFSNWNFLDQLEQLGQLEIKLLVAIFEIQIKEICL